MRDGINSNHKIGLGRDPALSLNKQTAPTSYSTEPAACSVANVVCRFGVRKKKTTRRCPWNKFSCSNAHVYIARW